MKAVRQTKQAKQGSKSLVSSLALAFDHCPSVLFAFLSDNEAARVARALCIPQFLSTKRYDIKRQLPVHLVVAGLFPGVVRRVMFDQVQGHDSSVLSLLPSSVTSMEVASPPGSVSSRLSRRVGDLPRSLTHLDFTRIDLGTVKPEDWPPSLTSLKLFRLETPALPSTLRVLPCNSSLSPSLVLPDTLTTLSAYYIGRPVSQLPPHLTSFSTWLLPGSVEPDEVSDFPASLTHLAFFRAERWFENDSDDENEPPEQLQTATLKLPPLLRSLHLESVPLNIHALPESLEELVIIRDMPALDHPFRHATLRKLVLPDGFNQPVRGSDFPSLQCLSLVTLLDCSLDDFPPLLTDLTVHSWHSNCHPVFDYLRQLKVLKFGRGFNKALDALPSGLTRLDLRESRSFNQPLDHLPDSLQMLLLPDSFNHPFQRLPSALKVLRFPSYTHFNHPLGLLPDSLSDLRLGSKFNQPFRRLPPSLTHLSLGNAFNHPLPISPESDTDSKASFHSDITYPTLRSLTLGNSFTHPLSLPPSLTELTLSGHPTVPLSIASLPEQLTRLRALLDRYPQLGDLEAVRKRCPLLTIENKPW